MIGFGVVALALGYGWVEKAGKTMPPGQQGLKLGTIRYSRPGSGGLEAAGYLLPQRVSRIAPMVAGKVAEVLVQQGDDVKLGQVLMTLDASEEEARMRALRAAAASAAAEVRLAEAKLKLVEIERQHAERWASREATRAAAGITPLGIVEELQADVTVQQASVEVAKRAYQASRAVANEALASVEVARSRMDHLVIRSPLAGTVMNRPPGPGEFVGPQPPGLSVDMGGIEIAATESLVAEVEVRERDWQRVAPGMRAEIMLDAFPQRTLSGEVLDLAPIVNKATATIMVKVRFIERIPGLRPSMGVRVRFLAASNEDSPAVPLVPEEAVVRHQGETAIFVLADEKIRRVSVKLGRRVDGHFELVEPQLADGAAVVMEPGNSMVGDLQEGD